MTKPTQPARKRAQIAPPSPRPWVALVIVAAVAFLSYAGSIDAGFVWDDRDLIVENPRVQSMNGATLRAIFTENFWGATLSQGGYYRPAVTLTYHVTWAMSGGSPAAFHFFNVLGNTLTCVLLFLLLYLLFYNVSLAALASLLFALHPLHTENVAWISGRTDVMATAYSLGSIVLYVIGRRQKVLARGAIFAGVSFLTFFIALLAKESAGFVPLILILLELPPLATHTTGGNATERIPRWVHPIPYFGVIALYLAMRASATGLSSHYEPYVTGALRFLGLPLALVTGYAWKLVAPFWLNAEWDVALPTSLLDVRVLIGALIVAGGAYALRRFRGNATVVLAAAFIILGFLPVMNVIPLGEISAERFAYLPSVGFVIVLALLIMHAEKGRIGWLAVVVLVAFGARTVTRIPQWHDETTFFAATAAASPESPRAHLNVGNAAMRNGRVPDAVRAWQRAIELDPEYPDALSNLAGLLVQQGRMADAKPLMERAVKASPENLTLLSNLGTVNLETGNPGDAAVAFRRATEIDDTYLPAHYGLGIARFQEGKYGDAERHLLRVAGRGGMFDAAFYYLAVMADEAGNTPVARGYAQHFLNASPRDAKFRARAKEILDGS